MMAIDMGFVRRKRFVDDATKIAQFARESKRRIMLMKKCYMAKKLNKTRKRSIRGTESTAIRHGAAKQLDITNNLRCNTISSRKFCYSKRNDDAFFKKIDSPSNRRKTLSSFINVFAH